MFRIPPRVRDLDRSRLEKIVAALGGTRERVDNWSTGSGPQPRNGFTRYR